MTLVRTDVSKEPIVAIIRVTRIGQIGTTLSVTNYLMREAIRSSEPSGIRSHVNLVRTYVSEEFIVTIIRAKRISGLGTMLAVTGN
jgi:hypothetical protein